MGLHIGFSNGSSEIIYSAGSEPQRDGNPNKYRFWLVRRLDFPKASGKVSVVEINYPDCFNHKGNKILVYNDSCILDAGLKSQCLDPHFLDDKGSPIARFEPTETGWILALSLAKLIAESSVEDET